MYIAFIFGLMLYAVRISSIARLALMKCDIQKCDLFCISADTSVGCQAPFGINNGNYSVLTPREYVPAMASNSEYISRRGYYRSETRVKYSCLKGYRLSSANSYDALCRNGLWYGDRPHCLQRNKNDRCGSIPNVPHGRSIILRDVYANDELRRLVADTYIHGTKVVYICDSGYQAIDWVTSAVECVMGEWSGRIPTCSAHVRCLVKPPAVLNAEITIYNSEGEVALAVIAADTVVNVAENYRAFYFCQSGYQLDNVSSAALVCSEGQWRGQLPSCGEY